ncbi:MAG: hypothetical protein HY403_04185, partial [Elusimicrobia bacterium]|nr:hypothetical protein [Elusimicrobiota bacterium]
RAALAAHLAAHPEAVDAVVQDNDVVLVHELTHAWQDRRDPVFREIARGNLPDAQPLEYEEEAYIAKNLYIRSKMKNDPASVKMDAEFADFSMMLHGPNAWRASLADLLRESSPSRALPLQSVEAIQAARLAKTRSRAEAAPEDRKAKALDLAGMELGQRELRALAAAHKARMAPIAAELDKASAGRAGLLGGFYLIQAQRAARRTDRTAFLDQAERYALASRDAALLEKIRGARRN